MEESCYRLPVKSRITCLANLTQFDIGLLSFHTTRESVRVFSEKIGALRQIKPNNFLIKVRIANIIALCQYHAFYRKCIHIRRAVNGYRVCWEYPFCSRLY